jgi:hypothetical protein
MSSKDNLARIDLAVDYSLAAPARPKLQVVEKPLEPHGPFLSVSKGQLLRQMAMLKEQPLKEDAFRDPALPHRPIRCYE